MHHPRRPTATTIPHATRAIPTVLTLQWLSCKLQSVSAYWRNTQSLRWISRDPIGERGGLNLSALENNDGDMQMTQMALVNPLREGQPQVTLNYRGTIEVQNDIR